MPINSSQIVVSGAVIAGVSSLAEESFRAVGSDALSTSAQWGVLCGVCTIVCGFVATAINATRNTT